MLHYMPLLFRWNKRKDNKHWRYFPPLSVLALSFWKKYASLLEEHSFSLKGFSFLISYFEWYGYLPLCSFSMVVDTFPFTANSSI